MYTAYFNLMRRPFEISPDPSLFYATAHHQEALAGLYYGIKTGKGFMVLTGEVGTGKTLVVRCLQELLDDNRVAYAYVFNPRLTTRQFLFYIAEDLGLSPHRTAKGDLLIALGRFLIERRRHGLTTVLVIEEAQHLKPVVLEEIRLLSNLETPQGKLLQILLIGQPELTITLDSPLLRQVKQRVALWFRLRLLSEEQTSHYIQSRLKLAGDKSSQIFTSAALQRIYRYSQGTPRLINILCDNAMMSAFAIRIEQVTPQLIDDAASDLGLKRMNGNGHSTASTIPLRAGEGTAEKIVEDIGNLAVAIESWDPETRAYAESGSSAKEGNG